MQNERGDLVGFCHCQTQITGGSGGRLHHSRARLSDVGQQIVWAGYANEYRIFTAKCTIVTNSLPSSSITILSAPCLCSLPSLISSSSSSLCPLVPVGVRDVARRVCGQRLWPPWALHPGCPLLVRGPLLLHRPHVGLPQGVQDEPLLPYQGMCHTAVTHKHEHLLKHTHF